MGTFLSRAEEILQVAISTSASENACENALENRDLVILIRQDGGMRIFDGAGWGLAGLLAEYGAREVYKVERRGAMLRVAGQSASQTCLLERTLDTRQYKPQFSARQITQSSRMPRPWQ